MAPIDLGSYKSIYLQTAKEYVGNLLSGYLKLTADPYDKEVINNIHISSHSLKSQSQVMGFTDTVAICANIEKISNDILNGIRKIDTEFLTLLKDSVDQINLKLFKIEKTSAA